MENGMSLGQSLSVERRRQSSWMKSLAIGAVIAATAIAAFVAGEARVCGAGSFWGRPGFLRVRGIELVSEDGSVKGVLGSDKAGSFFVLQDPKTGSLARLQVNARAGEVGLMLMRHKKSWSYLASDGEGSSLFLINNKGGSVGLSADATRTSVRLDAGERKGAKSEVRVNGLALKPSPVTAP